MSKILQENKISKIDFLDIDAELSSEQTTAILNDTLSGFTPICVAVEAETYRDREVVRDVMKKYNYFEHANTGLTGIFIKQNTSN